MATSRLAALWNHPAGPKTNRNTGSGLYLLAVLEEADYQMKMINRKDAKYIEKGVSLDGLLEG